MVFVKSCAKVGKECEKWDEKSGKNNTVTP